MIYLICGVPGSGKTWVLNHYTNIVHYDHHFNTPRAQYAQLLIDTHKTIDPLIADCPLGITEILTYVKAQNVPITPLFIVAPEHVIASQYIQREGKAIYKQHLSRIKTMLQRAHQYQAFFGTSDALLVHLNQLLNKS